MDAARWHTIAFATKEKAVEPLILLLLRSFKCLQVNFWEEVKVIQWFSKDKGKFLRDQQATTNFSAQHLTEEQKKEIEICSQIFEQLDDIDEELCLQINSTKKDTELPTFDLGFNLLFP